MMRIYVLMLVLLLTVDVYSQKQEWGISLWVGLNHSEMEKANKFITPKPISSLVVMISTEYEVIKHLRLGASFSLLNRGVTFGMFVNGEDVTAVNKLLYFSNQYSIKYRFGKRIKIMPYFGFGLDKLLSKDFFFLNEAPIDDIPDNELKNYENWIFSYLYGFEVKIRLTNYCGLSVLLQRVSTVSDLSKNDNISFMAKKTTNGQVLVGFNYIFRAGNCSSHK